MSISLTDQLLNLFKQAFETNCQLDGSTMTQEQANTLNELQPLQILQNLKDLLQSLLNLKRKLMNQNVKQLKKQVIQFQEMIQNLQDQVRSHIRIEQTIKLQLDVSEVKLQKQLNINEKLKNEAIALKAELQKKYENGRLSNQDQLLKEHIMKEMNNITEQKLRNMEKDLIFCNERIFEQEVKIQKQQEELDMKQKKIQIQKAKIESLKSTGIKKQEKTNAVSMVRIKKLQELLQTFKAE